MGSPHTRLGFRDTVSCHRVRAEEFRHVAVIYTSGLLHAVEKDGHGVGVIACIGQNADAKTIRFTFKKASIGELVGL